MTHTIPDRLEQALYHRRLAASAVNQTQAQYEIAVLDHVTARITQALPEATHVTFDFHVHDREAELHALWSTHHHGTEERILDARRDTDLTSLDFTELGDDLTDALAGHDSAAWCAVRPEPRPDKRWTLDLPPADRAGRIAELVLAHHPRARLLTLDVTRELCQVVGVTVNDDTGRPRQVRTGEGKPLWPAQTERQITVLARQIHALPHLRARHLARVGEPDERTVFLLLPEPGRADTKKRLS